MVKPCPYHLGRPCIKLIMFLNKHILITDTLVCHSMCTNILQPDTLLTDVMNVLIESYLFNMH